MTDIVLPTIGSSGYFELHSPLDTLIISGERHTCQAIRRISDYLANNEDVKTDVYTKLQLSDAEYEQDANDDMYIVSLQSDKGHWLYIPARYIVKYPLTNGIPYRTQLIGLSLASLPIDRDISFLNTELTNLIKDYLGITPIIKIVETSRVVLISKDKHDQLQAERNLVTQGRVTDRARYVSLLQEYQTALNKINELEQFIKSKLL